MQTLGQYVVSVSAAALLCGILKAVCAKGFHQPVIKLLCGIYIVISFVNPIRNLSFDIPTSLPVPDNLASQTGQSIAQESMRQVITEQTQAYILEKAESLSASIQVEVELDQGEYPLPQSVKITGKVPPVIREQLSNALEDELGIRKEDQTWIG